MEKQVLFAGCSYTAGSGLIRTEPGATTDTKSSPDLWVNLCHQHIRELAEFAVINTGQSGASNREIFQQVMAALSKFGSSIDTVFCQWTSMPRYNFNVGFELWDTSESLMTEQRSHDINLNRGDHWPRHYVTDLLDRLRVMHHLHWEILQVVEFVNIIKGLAKQIGVDRVYFINGLCPWDHDYFTWLADAQPESYTGFTKREILNIVSRDDSEIHRLYDMAHSQYRAAGGIDPSDWINLYGSFMQRRVDFNFDGIHPGIKSNRIYHELIKQRIQTS